MRPSFTVRLVLCLLLLIAFAGPEIASAGCRGKCVLVAPFCRRCQDAGFVTGVFCQDSGDCGCFYIQCAGPSPSASILQDEGQAMLADLGIVSQPAASTACASQPAVTFASLTN